jgi:hypothetical protein
VEPRHARGTGAALGALRGVWSVIELRRPIVAFAHTVLRPPADHTLENATGVGAPPRTWPADKWLVDVVH